MIISQAVYIQRKKIARNRASTTYKLQRKYIQFLQIQDFPSHVLSGILKS